jgi:hypothetical protein
MLTGALSYLLRKVSTIRIASPRFGRRTVMESDYRYYVTPD